MDLNFVTAPEGSGLKGGKARNISGGVHKLVVVVRVEGNPFRWNTYNNYISREVNGRFYRRCCLYRMQVEPEMSCRFLIESPVLLPFIQVRLRSYVLLSDTFRHVSGIHGPLATFTRRARAGNYSQPQADPK